MTVRAWGKDCEIKTLVSFNGLNIKYCLCWPLRPNKGRQSKRACRLTVKAAPVCPQLHLAFLPFSQQTGLINVYPKVYYVSNYGILCGLSASALIPDMNYQGNECMTRQTPTWVLHTAYYVYMGCRGNRMTGTCGLSEVTAPPAVLSYPVLFLNVDGSRWNLESITRQSSQCDSLDWEHRKRLEKLSMSHSSDKSKQYESQAFGMWDCIGQTECNNAEEWSDLSHSNQQKAEHG
jgi:hypothetical protein